jgi:AAHS family benzoate transporter-like MFS transporter
VGFASGVGRIGAIVAPVLIGWLISMHLPLEQNFMAIALAGLIGAVAVSLINQSLADSSQTRSAKRSASNAHTAALNPEISKPT